MYSQTEKVDEDSGIQLYSDESYITTHPSYNDRGKIIVSRWYDDWHDNSYADIPWSNESNSEGGVLEAIFTVILFFGVSGLILMSIAWFFVFLLSL